jgi:hypothetical protein
MISQMNTHNFKIFVEALEALPDDIKNRRVRINEIDEPTPNKAIGFSGIISIAAKNIEGLPEIYKGHFEHARAHNPHCKGAYNSNIWKIAYLEFIDGWDKFHRVGNWASDFDKTEDETLTANDIIIYFRREYDKYIRLEGEK